MKITDIVDNIIEKVNIATGHIASSSNPHSVNKTQVGLGNVDNTSDINKPISTATQTSLNTKVDKITSTTDNAIVRFDGTSGQVQNSSVIIDDSGNVGIGTSGPVGKDGASGVVQLEKIVGDAEFQVKAGGAWFSSYSTNSNGNGYGGWRHYNSAGVRSEWLYTAGDSALSLGTNGVERMRIDSAGNVGIGVSPSAKIHIGDGSNNSTTVKSTELLVTPDVGGYSQYGAGIRINRTWLDVSSIDFMVSLGGAGRYSAMTLGSSGNLLVGTTTDNGVDKLQVQGSISFRPLASATPTNNGDLTFEATSNTSVKVKLKGSDGVVRSATLTLS